MPSASRGILRNNLGVTMKKWRTYRKARSSDALSFAITNFVAFRSVNHWSGRFRCPSIQCANLKRATGVYDLSKGITYCHNCHIHRDSLALVSAVKQCSIDEAYDILDAAGVIAIDTISTS